jgi:hypothetical protein
VCVRVSLRVRVLSHQQTYPIIIVVRWTGDGGPWSALPRAIIFRPPRVTVLLAGYSEGGGGARDQEANSGNTGKTN